MFTRHVALSIFAFFASQASVAQAFPSSPPSGSYSERLDGRDTSGVGKRTPEIPIDSIKFVDAKDLKIIGKRTPDIPLDRVTWVDAQAVPDITARQSGYTSVNNALLDFMEGDLDIPLYCLAVSVGGKELVLSYENKDDRTGCVESITDELKHLSGLKRITVKQVEEAFVQLKNANHFEEQEVNTTDTD